MLGRRLPVAGDHPRIRGEHRPRKSSFRRPWGSSPHTRGAPRRRSARRCRWGIIPAYAGSTGCSATTPRSPADHPRIRGEHALSSIMNDDVRGSSPHTRGAHERATARPRVQRIIPAYAGSTPSPGPISRRAEDHPRIRGEHFETAPFITSWIGSSPHTRGAHPGNGLSSFAERIIPAYAGSTLPTVLLIQVTEDHPRIRGEHVGAARSPWGGWGSSPHTRGARRARVLRAFRARIIPAYAGSTPRSSGD